MADAAQGGYGLLGVNTFFRNIGFPAEGVSVTVRDSGGDIVSQTRTDREGEIQPIRLPAPPLSYSQEPDGERPFSQYDVTAALDGYETAVIRGVQIYSDSTAVQNISLLSQNNDVTIPYPTLWGVYPPKIPEASIKKLPFGSDLAVLPEPVVPEFIVVHDGVPDDSRAENYTLRFKDYINNVASSEIYPSWNREALKANILAIISFTLSRVYTEWYRSKGYDFTITSSTAYDQAFFYGRNIFREIADVTDEIFNVYITKANMEQPLFTQYSDGRRVVRDGWLSQWGSQELAQQGYSAIQILKYYYGYEIVLREAKRVQGIPLSFTGVLKRGSRGERVRVVQSQINAIARNYPLIPRLVEDGIYGERTERSVRVFQEIFYLPVTGVVNFPTWYKLSDIYNAVTGAGG